MPTDNIIETLLMTVVTTLLSASGFWVFIQRKTDRKTSIDQLVIALVKERLLHLCSQYISRGYITPAELRSILELQGPYVRIGGNGVVAGMIKEVKDLPIRNKSQATRDAIFQRLNYGD